MKRARHLGPELTFLIECCRFNFLGSEAGRPQVQAGLDFEKFVRLCRFHRVQGLAWNALGGSEYGRGDTALHHLSTDARAIAATNLAAARECEQLLQAFHSGGKPILFLKGLTVAALAYRIPMLKMASDTDCLIDQADLSFAKDVLLGLGFRVVLPLDPSDLEPWHARSKESVWTRSDGIQLELHTRVADSGALVPTLNVHSPSQVVEVAGGIALPTFAPAELFAYLCVHGASSAWFRLKWITDVAGLLSVESAAEIEHSYRQALQLGARRCAAQALLLADVLYGPLAAIDLIADLRRGAYNRRLLDLAIAQLRNADGIEPTASPLGTWRIHLNQLAIGGSVSFGLQDAFRQVMDAVTLRKYSRAPS